MNLAIILIIALMAATFVVLLLGIVQMAKGGKGNALEQGERSNKLMVWRVTLQGAALLIAFLVMYAMKK
ncbi:MAG: twin transmembrane helix small protein [Rickettsiales bacterium]